MVAAIYTDGSSRGNPGPAGCGYAIYLGDETILERFGIGWATSNTAEVRALIAALEKALSLGVTDVVVRMDSKWTQGAVAAEKPWKLKAPHLIPLVEQARKLVDEFDSCVIEWVPRDLNAVANDLAQEASGTQKSTMDQMVPATDYASRTTTGGGAMAGINEKGEMTFGTAEEAFFALDATSICVLSSGNQDIHCGRCRYCLTAQPALDYLRDLLGVEARL